jgi:hypothetical protein
VRSWVQHAEADDRHQMMRHAISTIENGAASAHAACGVRPWVQHAEAEPLISSFGLQMLLNVRV